MSAHRWRNGGYYFPPTPATPADPRSHGYPNYHTYNNPSYFHATPPPQHHRHLITSRPPYNGLYSAQNSLYGASQYNPWTGPVQPLRPAPPCQAHSAILRTQCESFTFQAPNYSSTPYLDQISRTKPSNFNSTVQMQHAPSSTSRKVEAPGAKQAADNTGCTPATPIAVMPAAKKSIQWPKPDIELVVKDGEPSVRRKRKRNNKKKRKGKVEKEVPTEQMVRDPWLTIKPVAGIIVKQRAVDSVIGKKEKCGKVEAPDAKQAADNTGCTRATPIAVTPAAKKSIQWPKPDIDLVVKDEEPSVTRKRKRNNKKVKKEAPAEQMHYYRKHMVRDPWCYIKPVVGIIVKQWAVGSVIEKKRKCESGVKVDYSKMSLADCLEMSFEDTITGDNTVTVYQN